MSAPAASKRDPLLRFGVVALLLAAAALIALPWLVCMWNPARHMIDPVALRVCTFGFPGPSIGPGTVLPGLTGPYWGNLVLGIVYLVAGAYVAVTRRPP